MWKHIIKKEFGTGSYRLTPIHGGDINEALLVNKDNNKYFIKHNSYPQGLAMLQSEARDLKLLVSQNIPSLRPIAVNFYDDINYLVLPYVESQLQNKSDFLQSLMKLHRVTGEYFGKKDSSFLGDYEFNGGTSEFWSVYFVEYRIFPLIESCVTGGFLSPTYLKSKERYIESLIKKTPYSTPRLLHGDLWSGNLHETAHGTLFIDPSTLYGHPDLDLSMLYLFGGKFKSYVNDYIKSMSYEHHEFANRMKMYQSYYLLFHLWKFGKSYLNQTTESLNTLLR